MESLFWIEWLVFTLTIKFKTTMLQNHGAMKIDASINFEEWNHQASSGQTNSLHEVKLGYEILQGLNLNAQS